MKGIIPPLHPPFRFSGHAIKRMAERGIIEAEVYLTIRFGDAGYSRRNRIVCNSPWRKFHHLRVVVDPKTRTVITAFPYIYPGKGI